jgi:Sulfotransferase family
MSLSKHSARLQPMPIIVGVPRSGTTLLRMMLDAHSEMAIPPETGFIPGLMDYQTHGSRFRRALKRAIPRMSGHSSSENDLREIFFVSLTQSPLWPQFQIAHEHLKEGLLQINPFTISMGVRTFYRLYAERFVKRRWGDKTPSYSFHLQAVERCLPESRFIHV